MIHVLFCFSINLILTRTCYVLVIYVSSTCHSPRDGIFGVVNFVVSKPFYCNVKIPLRFIKKYNKTPYNDKKTPPNNPNKQTPQQNKKIPKNKTKQIQAALVDEGISVDFSKKKTILHLTK